MTAQATHLPDLDWPVTKPFWDGCREGILRLPRCACGTWVWYPQPRCPSCRGSRIEWQAVSGDGRLFTWVTVHRSFVPALAARVPYTTGIVELVESPVLRVTSFLHGELSLGAPMRVRFEPGEGGIALPVFDRV